MVRINLKYALSFVLFLSLVSSTVFGATVSPNTWSTSILAGDYDTKIFNLTFVNETCTRTLSGTAATWLSTTPQFFSADGMTMVSLPITVTVQSGTASGTYSAILSYCNSSISISVSAIATGTQQCNLIITILGSKERGKTMAFDVRDSSYAPRSATMYLTRADSTTETLDCTGGYCTWLIPPTEEGPIVMRTVVVNCTPVTKQIELTGAIRTNETTEVGGAKISVSGPTEVDLGENFQFLLIAQNMPVKLAEVSIIGPEGYTLSATSNQYGIVVDSAKNKIFGTEIKPDKVGEYKMFVSQTGKAPSDFSFKIIRKACPYECCISDSYEKKNCNSGFDCVDNACKEIKKPKLTISCTSPAYLFESSVCKLLKPNGETLGDSVQGTLNYKGETTNIIFPNGEVNLSWDKLGGFSITIPDVFDYEGITYMDTVVQAEIKTPWFLEFSWLLVWLVLIIVFVIFIWAIKWMLGKRGTRGGYEIEGTAPATVEKEVREK